MFCRGRRCASARTFNVLFVDGFQEVSSNNYHMSELVHFQNTGSASSPSFAAEVSNPFNISADGTYVSPFFADIDLDGDFDIFAGRDDGSYTVFREYRDG